MPLLRRKSTLLAKIETTYGTDAAPTGSANAILVANLTATPIESEYVDRDLIRAYLGASEQLPAAIHAQLEFDCEVAGSGAAGTAPAWGPLLRACGFAETVTPGVKVEYKPVSSGFESATLYFNLDGVLHKLLGARGTVSIAMSARERPLFRFRFVGLYVAVADAAAPTTDYTAWKRPLPVNKVNTPTLSLHGYAGAVMSELSIDAGVSPVYRSLVGAERVDITDRQMTGSITLEAVTVATKDWWSAVRDATLGSLQLVHGTASGNKVQLDAPAVQLTTPRYADLDGVAMLSMAMRLLPSAGNDELTITAL